jgi:hypothetical protein
VRFALACLGLLGGCGTSTTSPAAGPVDAGPPPPLLLPDAADPTPPTTVGGVTPSRAFLARHSEILVTGYSARWSNATRVDLGPDVTITNLSAPRSDLLAVDFGVAPTATPGPRDVSVLDGDGGVVLGRGSLTLDAPVALTFEGTLAQGSIVVAHAAVVDPSIPLDTTSTKDPFGVPTFVDLAAVLPGGLSGTVFAASAYAADVELFIDTGASGGGAFDLVSGPPASPGDVHFPLPAGLTVASRTPAPLMPGMAASGSVDGAYATGLFAYGPASAAVTIVDFAATSAASGADPAVLLLPASGRWSDELTGGAVATWLTSSTDPLYAVYFDDAGKTGAYSVGVVATPAAASAAATVADATKDGAVVAPALPFVLTGGQLTSASSQDWIRVTTGPGDSGRKLHVQSAGDPRTFLDVTLYDDQGSSVGGNENGGPVNAFSVPVGASRTYYVVFSPGAGFDPAHGGYEGIVRLE